MTHLVPEHYDDLKKSGLSDKTILASGIRAVPPDQFKKRLGFPDKGIESLMEIPFSVFDDNEYSRYKVWYQEGHKGPKYLTQKGSVNRLYIPHKALDVLGDVSVRLDITEGEKKALKACQEGLHCIGITGLWNWKVKGVDELIPDFDRIALHQREIVITPDSDWMKEDKHGHVTNLVQAVDRLASALIKKGAKVYWRNLN
ncbi:MAG: DUF3854 domain-containing protein [Candidatus Scalindua sp.]|jgi:putative DNA primase/helicase|nr:DUF3854 domain-containing protein [Candidatus Scalindua sp.]